MSGVGRFAWATLCFNEALMLWAPLCAPRGIAAVCGDKWPGCGGSILGTNVLRNYSSLVCRCCATCLILIS